MTVFTEIQHFEQVNHLPTKAVIALTLVENMHSAPSWVVEKVWDVLPLLGLEGRYSMEHLLVHPNLPVNFMDLNQEGERRERRLRDLAQNPSLPNSMARELFLQVMEWEDADNAFRVFNALLRRLDFTYEDVLRVERKLSAYNRFQHFISSSYPSFPEGEKDSLVSLDPEGELTPLQQGQQRELAVNRTLTEEQARGLSLSGDYRTLINLAGNPRTPSDLLYFVHRYGTEQSGIDNILTRKALSNPSFSLSTMRFLFGRMERSQRTRGMSRYIAENPVAPDDMVIPVYEREEGERILFSHELSDELWERITDTITAYAGNTR